MEDVIKQFLALPPAIRLAVSSPQAIEKLEQIESRYNVKLANTVLRVMTKELPVSALQTDCEKQFSLSQDRAKALCADLMREIFSQASGHLGISRQAVSSSQTTSMPIHDMSLGEIHTDPDVLAHAQKLLLTPAPQAYDAAAFATKLIDDFGISLPDDNMKKRFKIVVESRLVDARSSDETKERLMRETKIGGLDFDEAMSTRIVDEIQKESERIHALHMPIKAADVETIAPAKPQAPKMPVRHPDMPKLDLPPSPLPPKNISKSAPTPPVQVKPPAPPVLESTMTPPLPPGVVMRPKVTPQNRPTPSAQPVTPFGVPQAAPVASPVPPVAPVPTPSNVPHFMPKVFRTDIRQASRVQVADITSTKKLVGPVEEMQQMTIQDFRKLGSSPKDSAARMKEVISILEQESLSQRSAGIKAWRQSPMMREYLELGNASMEQGKSVDDVIDERRHQNPQSMTKDEFNIIASLNRSLRY